MNVLTSLSPASQDVQAIDRLWMIAIAIFGLIALFVIGLIVFSLMRYRWREGEPDPVQVPGQHTVEVVWTVIPLGIVTLLFVLTVKTMGVTDPASSPPMKSISPPASPIPSGSMPPMSSTSSGSPSSPAK